MVLLNNFGIRIRYLCQSIVRMIRMDNNKIFQQMVNVVDKLLVYEDDFLIEEYGYDDYFYDYYYGDKF